MSSREKYECESTNEHCTSCSKPYRTGHVLERSRRLRLRHVPIGDNFVSGTKQEKSNAAMGLDRGAWHL